MACKVCPCISRGQSWRIHLGARCYERSCSTTTSTPRFPQSWEILVDEEEYAMFPGEAPFTLISEQVSPGFDYRDRHVPDAAEVKSIFPELWPTLEEYIAPKRDNEMNFSSSTAISDWFVHSRSNSFKVNRQSTGLPLICISLENGDRMINYEMFKILQFVSRRRNKWAIKSLLKYSKYKYSNHEIFNATITCSPDLFLRTYCRYADHIIFSVTQSPVSWIIDC